MQVKITQNNVTNSPDSSEESSGGSPSHFNTSGGGGLDGPNVDLEEILPSVMISKNATRMEFLCQLSALGASIGEDRLREGARLLLSALPRCRHTEKSLREAFSFSPLAKPAPYNLLFNHTDPAVVLYRLEVLYTMLFPSLTGTVGVEVAWELLNNFFISGGALSVVEMLTKNNFMPLADISTKRSAYLAVLRLTKAVLTVTSLLVLKVEVDGCGQGQLLSERGRILGEAMKHIPNAHAEGALRTMAEHVAKSLHCYVKGGGIGEGGGGALRGMLSAALERSLPDAETIRLLMKLAGATASGSLAYFSSDGHQANREPFEEDVFGEILDFSYKFIFERILIGMFVFFLCSM